MKILFLRPKLPSTIEREQPLGIMYLVSVLKEKFEGIQVNFMDAHVKQYSVQETCDIALKENYDIIFVSLLSVAAEFAYEFTNRIKKENKHVKVIFGGVHATTAPEECLQNGVDYCAMGEGEIIIVNLINGILNNGNLTKIKGLAYKDEDGELKINPPEELIQDLDTLPYPDYSILDIKNYNTTIHTHSTALAAPIIASRGCANNCPFCCSKQIWRRKIRSRTVDNVLGEIRYLIDKYNIHEFHFYDDDFLCNKKFIKEFAKKVIEERIQIKFCCIATVRALLQLDEETIIELKDAGLEMIEFGIESLDKNVLKYLTKTYSLDDLPLFIRKVKQFNLNIYPLLMYMVPNETLSGYLHQSMLFLKYFSDNKFIKGEWKLDELTFIKYAAAYTPYPGTDIWNNVNQYGIKLTDDLQYYNTERIVFIPYSLLDEIPNVGELSNLKEDIKQLCIELLHRNLIYADFEYKEVMIDEIVGSVDGNKNIREISEVILEKFPGEFDENQAIAITVLSILVLLLKGILKPAA